MSKIVEFNIDDLIDNNLTFEAYFVLYTVYCMDYFLLEKYLDNYGKFQKDLFTDLLTRNFVKLRREDNIVFDNIVLTEKGKKLFIDEGLINKLFEEFKEYYPTKGKTAGGRTRSLYDDPKRCKRLYAKALRKVSHETLCKCARLYCNPFTGTGDFTFIKNLTTWLNKECYMQYVEEAEKADYIPKEGYSEGMGSYSMA